MSERSARIFRRDFFEDASETTSFPRAITTLTAISPAIIKVRASRDARKMSSVSSGAGLKWKLGDSFQPRELLQRGRDICARGTIPFDRGEKLGAMKRSSCRKINYSRHNISDKAISRGHGRLSTAARASSYSQRLLRRNASYR